MTRTEDSLARASGQEPPFALHHDSWMRILLKLLPGALEGSGVKVSDEEVRVRIHPGAGLRIPRDAVTRVWRTRAGDQGILFWLPPILSVHTNFRGVWWLNGSLDNLVAFDVDPAATGRMWGIPVKPKRVIVSLDDPDGFIAKMLG